MKSISLASSDKVPVPELATALAASGLTATDPGNPSPFALIMMLVGIVAAVSSFADNAG